MLNELELETLQNQLFFQQKRQITDKFYVLFGELIEALKNNIHHLNFIYPEGTDTKLGKISRGENYQGLPFLMTDFPRKFTRNNVFAFRTWLWWGNYVLFIWHFSGDSLKNYQESLLKKFVVFQQNDCYLYIADDEWQHHLDLESYVRIKSVTFSDFKTLISTKPFVKIVRKLDFRDLASLKIEGIKSFELIITE